MEIRIHQLFVELIGVWGAVCHDIKELVAKGATWDVIEPMAVEVSLELIRPDYQELYVRLAKAAYEKYEKEMLS